MEEWNRIASPTVGASFRKAVTRLFHPMPRPDYRAPPPAPITRIRFMRKVQAMCLNEVLTTGDPRQEAVIQAKNLWTGDDGGLRKGGRKHIKNLVSSA